MKAIIILLISIFFISGTPTSAPDKITLIIAQVPYNRCIATNIDGFWRDKQYFDTIQFTGNSLVKQINTTLSSLSLERGNFDISYESCLIRFSKGKAIDTFYSWRWFDNFKKGTIMYYDSTKQLSGLFKKFYHSQWNTIDYDKE